MQRAPTSAPRLAGFGSSFDVRIGLPQDSIASASSGAATTSPATGTTRATSAVTRKGSATAPQPVERGADQEHGQTTHRLPPRR